MQENITERILALKSGRSQLFRSAAWKEGILYKEADGGKNTLTLFDLKDKKETSLIEADVLK